MKNGIFSLALVFFALLSATTQVWAGVERPSLIVLVVIDQFRADYLSRFESKFLPAVQSNGSLGGFRYLMSHGAYFPQAKYQVLNSVTAVGHATISTGSYPYQSGIIANSWLDRSLNQEVYCVQDDASPLVGGDHEKKESGRSPRNLIGTTLGDQLKLSYSDSHVVSLSLKDRSAILLGGHSADLAFWFDRKMGQWTTSEFYLPSRKLPEWLTQLNQRLKPMIQKTDESTEYTSLKDFLATPAGNEMTVQTFETALKSLNLGRGKAVDLLAVSLSSHDMAGHRYGPNSVQLEEMTLSDDQTLSKILNAVKGHMPRGLKDVLVVLTADHGVAPNEDTLRSLRIPTEKINVKTLKANLERELEIHFGKKMSEPWILDISTLQIYLNRSGLIKAGIEIASVESYVRDLLKTMPGLAHILSSSDFSGGHLPPGKFSLQAHHTYFPGRSGDLMMITKPFVSIELGSSRAANHLTGYSYDQTVPIIFLGAAFKRGVFPEAIEVVDIAPTLAWVAGVIPPSSSEGRVVSEALIH